ncbi:MAG: bifunctional riboflavin kinase/FAD synthetase [Bacteroidetes bacterium]|nr:bifunctional riboflavin kinase/FAD synthetase [Bacteroidota bacterium]MBP8752679.1 bifunctional riboflavin kinase/FAD synthetase [Chitinophagales bacterium]MBK7110104.1 bifunctional riboflavin kinase/FAD synthetase [Bacteroidota bacterium]MBK8487170.1 bifunctional riboflavin kinase/FAD synthetase [Bacteroidota bacterium]MBK8680556.1 bifunctional riboflavin kinase/FAD synthetase [Bacteroidota bacterium]
MRVFRNLDQLPQFSNAVITIGTFDGVHNGHKVIIRNIVQSAKENDGESVIITFHPHPRNIINPQQALLHLNTIEEKLALLKDMGVDNVVVVPFSREFSEMEAEDYIKDFLIGKFQPKIIVFGYDHRFGKDRRGDIHLLKAIAKLDNITVHEVGKQEISDITISSTKIRNYLKEGNLHLANELLGYNYMMSGIVVRGDQIGRELGYPTANLQIQDTEKLIPANGIYAVKVSIRQNSNLFYGMMSIGTRPTFDGTDTRIEVHIFQLQEDIYGDTLTVEFIEFIRKEEKFINRETLQQAMAQDKEFCEILFDNSF